MRNSGEAGGTLADKQGGSADHSQTGAGGLLGLGLDWFKSKKFQPSAEPQGAGVVTSVVLSGHEGQSQMI